MENEKKKIHKCNICKIRGYIECSQCEDEIYFCSRGHLHTHQLKYHKQINKEEKNNIIERNAYCYKNSKNFNSNQNLENNKYNDNNIDPRKQFEMLQNLKNDIDNKIKDNRISEAMISINKLLNTSSRFYPNDHLFVFILFNFNRI